MLKAEKSQKGIPGRATSSSKDQEGGSPHGAESGTHEKMTETRRASGLRIPEDSESHGKALTCWGHARHRVNTESILVIRIRLRSVGN